MAVIKCTSLHQALTSLPQEGLASTFSTTPTQVRDLVTYSTAVQYEPTHPQTFAQNYRHHRQPLLRGA